MSSVQLIARGFPHNEYRFGRLDDLHRTGRDPTSYTILALTYRSEAETDVHQAMCAQYHLGCAIRGIPMLLSGRDGRQHFESVGRISFDRWWEGVRAHTDERAGVCSKAIGFLAKKLYDQHNEPVEISDPQAYEFYCALAKRAPEIPVEFRTVPEATAFVRDVEGQRTRFGREYGSAVFRPVMTFDRRMFEQRLSGIYNAYLDEATAA